MAQYSEATTSEDLSSLIDKALSGEEVVITRNGKPAVALTVVGSARDGSERTQAEWMEWLRERREKLPSLGIDGANLVRQMRDAGGH
jgi:prevent-host-death family protein